MNISLQIWGSIQRNLEFRVIQFLFWVHLFFGLVDCNPQLRNICIKEILGF